MSYYSSCGITGGRKVNAPDACAPSGAETLQVTCSYLEEASSFLSAYSLMWDHRWP